ncbi:MAG: GGDEF domain-containing protein [Pseudomonadota bacterium]
MKLLTTKQVVIRITVIIAVVELLIMLVLAVIPHKLNSYTEAVLDVILLIVLSTPPIFIWVIKPFVIARDEALAQISHLAHIDPLTQLANRRLLTRHLERTIAGIARHKVYGALLLLDLDGFKPINDAYGHDAGDAVLVEIAKRMQSITRPDDVVGRLGGDEFVVLINHLDADKRIAHKKVLRIAEKLRQSIINSPIDYNGKKLRIGASIGIRLLGIEELDVETAIREADIAMYRAKQAGGKCVDFFEQ